MNVTLKRVKKINTSDILYDTKLKRFCIYPQKNININLVDVKYIKKHCLKLKLKK